MASSSFLHGKSPSINNFQQQNPVQGFSSSPYLPSFLLGSNSPASPANNTGYSRKFNSSMNNAPNSTSRLSFQSPKQNTSPPSSFMISPPPSEKYARFSHTENDKLMRKDKSGAPPTESLYSTKKNNFEDPTTPSFENLQQTRLTTTIHEESFKSFRDTLLQHDTDADKMQSPAQVDPFYSQGDAISSEDILDETAITVFGFPPSACSYILQQFSQHGRVEKYEVHNQGNWMHIKYQTKLQAKKALSKNGKIFARSIMIGVCPCIKKEICNMETSYLNATNATDLDKTPVVVGSKRPSSTMRSLSAKSNTPSSANLFQDKGTPQKKDSVVSKALDYVFGF